MDDKRFYRDLKKDIKKTGNRKRRRFLKDLSADPGEFDYGSAESSAFNGMGEMEKGKRKKEKASCPRRKRPQRDGCSCQFRRFQ